MIVDEESLPTRRTMDLGGSMIERGGAVRTTIDAAGQSELRSSKAESDFSPSLLAPGARVKRARPPETGQQAAREHSGSSPAGAAELDRLQLEEENRQLKKHCAELRERVRCLEEMAALKTRVLLNMNHEIRSPLNSISALTTLLLRRGEAEDAKLAGYIRKAADAVLDLVNDSVDLVLLEGGEIEARPAPFVAAECLDTLRGLLPEPLVNPAVRLIFEEATGIPALESDQGKILQILRNLINNALKFTVRGEVRVSVRYDAAADWMFFSVRDTGVGIAPDARRRIFDAQARPENPRDLREKRSGLGLPLCLRLAALLRGRLMVESEPGAGSRFVLALPRRLGDGDDDSAPDDRSGLHDSTPSARLLEAR